jgi:hypothetical protein
MRFHEHDGDTDGDRGARQRGSSTSSALHIVGVS